MKLIVAVDENWGIGKKGDLLMSIPDDMKYFRKKTERAVLVMGYNTLLSFPGSRPLPGRLNIVLADVEGLRVPGAAVCNTMEQLLSLLEAFRSDDLYVIGGGMMYRQLLPYCDTALITKMCFKGEADTFIPNLDELPEWSVYSESDKRNYEGLEYSFVEYHNDDAIPLRHSPSQSDITAFFARREKLIFPLLHCEDEAYREALSDIVSALFYPLSAGLTAEQVKDFLSLKDAAVSPTFFYYLHSGRMIACAEDIPLLNDRFSEDETAQTCTVCVMRDDAKEFIQMLKAASMEEIAEKFKAEA